MLSDNKHLDINEEKSVITTMSAGVSFSPEVELFRSQMEQSQRQAEAAGENESPTRRNTRGPSPRPRQSFVSTTNLGPLPLATEGSLAGGLPDEGWHGARSSGNVILPHMSGAPSRRRRVYVEHTNGLFVPQSVHEEVKRAEERKLASLMMGSGQQAGGLGQGAAEDPADFFSNIEFLKQLIKRLSSHLAGFLFGFATLMFILSVTDPTGSTQTNFLSAYANFSGVEHQLFMVIGMLIIIMHPFQFAWELGTMGQKKGSVTQVLSHDNREKNNRTVDDGSGSTQNVKRIHRSSVGGTAAIDVDAEMDEEEENNKVLALLYGSAFASPWRHFSDIQFLFHLGSLACTVVITSVVQGRTDGQIRDELDDNYKDNIRIAVITRAVLMGVAWVLSLRH